MMMARGVSLTGEPKEARIWAAVELINKLAMTCYTLKIDERYYSIEGSEHILETKECPGLFRVVPDKEVPTTLSAFKYIKDFFNKEDSDCELVFTNPKMMCQLIRFARKNPQFDRRKLSVPNAQGINPIAVFKRRTPQYWRDKILASGKMENENYILTPPQGLGIYLLETNDVIKVTPWLLKSLPTDPSYLYDPQTTSEILCQQPPWEIEGSTKQNRRQHQDKFMKNKKINYISRRQKRKLLEQRKQFQILK